MTQEKTVARCPECGDRFTLTEIRPKGELPAHDRPRLGEYCEGSGTAVIGLIPLATGYKIADTGEPVGLFVCSYIATPNRAYEAIDSTGDELVTRGGFSNYEAAREWLLSEDRK